MHIRNIYIYIYIYYEYAYTHTYTYTHIYIYTYTCINRYIYTYIHTYTFRYTYTYTPTLNTPHMLLQHLHYRKHAIASWVFTVKSNIEKAIKIPHKSNIMKKYFTHCIHCTINVMSLVILICNEKLLSSYPTKTNINERDFSQT